MMLKNYSKRCLLFFFLRFFSPLFLLSILFIYSLCWGVLGLRCCMQASSSCGEWGLSLVAECRLLHGGFPCCRAQALRPRVSAAAAPRL